MNSTARTWLAVDTLVMVAAACGPGDRLWEDWIVFDRTAPPDRLIARAAVKEFERVVEGIGGPDVGIFEQLIGDAAVAVWLCAPKAPSDAELEKLGLDENRCARVQKIMSVLQGDSGEWDSKTAIDYLRAYEAGYAVRKHDFLTKHPIYDPVDADWRDKTANELALLIPDGGESWGQDCLILAESGAHSLEKTRQTAFVSEDRKHLQPHRKDILRITGMSDLRDLAGNSI